MSKEVWGWILSQRSTKELANLVTNINDNTEGKKKIKINGITNFKKLNDSRLNLFRKILEKEMLKSDNIELIRRYYKIPLQDASKDYTDFENFNSKSVDDISSILITQKDIDWASLFTYMMTNTEHIEKGLLLFNKLYASGGIALYENRKAEKKKEDGKDLEGEKDNNKDHNKDHNKDKKSIDSTDNNEILIEDNRNLKTELSRLHSENISIRKSIEKMQRTINEYEKIIKKKDKEIESRRNEISARDKNIIKLNEEIKTYDTKIQDLLKDNSILDSELKEASKKIAITQKSILNNAITPQKNKKKILLIDRTMPKLEEKSDIDLALIDKDQLYEPSNYDFIDNADEIWFLKFKVPQSYQIDLTQRHGKKVIGFISIQELKKYYYAHK